VRQCRIQYLVIRSSENLQHKGCLSTENESSIFSGKPVILRGVTDAIDASAFFIKHL